MLDSFEKIIDPNFISSELIGTEGAEKVVTITDFALAEGYDKKTKSKVTKPAVYFKECKPLMLNKTNSRKLKRMFSPNEDKPELCVGHKITLRVEKTKVAGEIVDCIRIHEYSETRCEDCGEVINATRRYSVAELVDISKRNTGKVLCVSCMKKYNKNDEEAQA